MTAKATTTITTTTTETEGMTIPTLDDDAYSIPTWAAKVVNEIAEAGREPTRQQKLLRITRLGLVLFAFLGLMFFLGLTMYWIGQPYGKPVVEFHRGIQILRADGTSTGPIVVEAGGNVLIQASYCKNHDTLRATIRREFHDDLVYQLPDYTTNAPRGCGTRFSTSLKIPENLPPDTYTLVFTFVYQINPIRSVNYTFETNEFTVTAPPAATP